MQLKNSVKIENKSISIQSPTFVIAEIGSNHDGSLDEAIRYIHAAKEAGADAVKFQSFSAEGLISRKRPIQSNPNQGWEPHPAYPIIEKLELPDHWHSQLKKECDQIDIIFMSAPFDIKKARLLRDIGTRVLKIASGELTNFPLLQEIGTYGLPIILSTGIATLAEVQSSIDVLTIAGCQEIVLLHCVSNYPPQFNEMNVKCVSTLATTFGCPIGISDHTPGWTVPILACGLGSCCVEKHVTFDRKRKGPDHAYALEWPEFKKMVQELRHAEAALGNGIKAPSKTEASEALFARKGLYASCDLKIGDCLTPENIKWVRHAFGIPASQAHQVYGKILKRPRLSDEAILWDDLKS